MYSSKSMVIVFLGILVTGLFLSHQTVQANPLERNTEMTIEFDMLLLPPVVDPLNPDLEKTPDSDEGDVNTESGELTLDFAPNLYFGSHKIKQDGTLEFPVLVNADKEANPTENTSNPFVQVTDRQAISGDWELNVHASAFQNSLTNSSSLDGAFLTFSDGVLDNPSINLSATPPTLNQDINLISDGDTENVMRAGIGEGELTWIAHWIPTDNLTPSIKLTVPSGTMKKGLHTADLTWTLSTLVSP